MLSSDDSTFIADLAHALYQKLAPAKSAQKYGYTVDPPLEYACSVNADINLALGIFNLVPAFPMDGGRVLRAILGSSGDWVLATERAVKVGRVFAILMIVGGLMYSSHGLTFLPLIGVFVWYTGARELWSVRMRHGQFPFGRRAAGAPAAAFGAAGADGFQQAEVHDASPRPGPAEDSDEQRARARRPGSSFEDDELGGPLDDKAIERLENFRGPLRQFRPEE